MIFSSYEETFEMFLSRHMDVVLFVGSDAVGSVGPCGEYHRINCQQ